MRIVSRNGAHGDRLPRLHFVHIPKTAGITINEFFRSNYPRGEALVLDERASMTVSRDTLLQHHFLSSHYSFEMLQTLGERPDMTVMLVREPVSRYRSWLEHGRRSTMPEYRATCDQGTALEVLRASDSYAARQAHWLVRAFEQGTDYKSIPSAEDLPRLLRRVDLCGLVEEIERFKQLVCFRLGWAPPQLDWRFNQAPQDSTSSARVEIAAQRDDIQRELAVDFALYEMASARFWGAYADMLSALRPDAEAFTPENASTVPLALVQDWLGHHHAQRLAANHPQGCDHVEISADEPLPGSGWWWRNTAEGVSWFWSGPDARATLSLPPLKSDRSYGLRIDLMGAANWPAWEGTMVEINGQRVHAVRERLPRHAASDAICRLHVTVHPGDIARSPNGATNVVLDVPETRRIFQHIINQESQDTFNRDDRAVGVAFHALHVTPIAPRPRPALSLRPGRVDAPRAAAEEGGRS